MELQYRSETFQQDDQKWLGSAHGTDMARPVTLDISAFTEGTHFPDGYLPSGLPLGKITATGLYGPYSGEDNETQTLTRTSTGGTITLEIDGEVTDAIAASAAGFTAAAVQTAVDALSNVDEEHTITVSGSAGGPLTLTYGGLWADENVPEVTVDNGSATGGTIVAATANAGGSVASGLETLVGFLFTDVTVSGSGNDPIGAMLDHCRVVEAKLPLGSIDASGKRDVAGRIWFI